MKLGIIMDPISQIKVSKNSSFAMLLEAERRGWQIFYMEQADLFIKDQKACAHMRHMHVQDDPEKWFSFTQESTQALAELDVILMRKDPPFDTEFIYTTYILELAEQEGVLVLNKPQSLRDANEKMFTAWFPQCCPPTIVTRRREHLHEFIREHQDVIAKPLEGMGGQSIFRLRSDDPNINVVYETLSNNMQKYFMVQRYIPEISQGDKRILMINGEPIPYALARIAPPGETRANLSAGGHGEGRELTERDSWICQQVGPSLREKGLIFVGIDVIGDYLTEINVTSPMCIRELDELFNINIAGQLMDYIVMRQGQNHIDEHSG